jgi:hypothetical protein
MNTSNIGEDEWVEQHASRSDWRRDPWDWALQRLNRISPLALIGSLAGLAALLPLITSSDYVLRVGGADQNGEWRMENAASCRAHCPLSILHYLGCPPLQSGAMVLTYAAGGGRAMAFTFQSPSERGNGPHPC